MYNIHYICILVLIYKNLYIHLCNINNNLNIYNLNFN